MLLFLTSLAFLALLSFASPVAKRTIRHHTVAIQNGTTEGALLPTSTQDAFLGVSFARPDAEDLRLRKLRLDLQFERGVYEPKEYSPFHVAENAAICLTKATKTKVKDPCKKVEGGEERSRARRMREVA